LGIPLEMPKNWVEFSLGKDPGVMTASERLQTFDDVRYLVWQMIHAERRVDLVNHLVFYYERWAPPNAVRLTREEERFFGDALLNAFLLSYRNLLDFFCRPSRKGNNPHGDSLAEVDFSFCRSLVPDTDAEFTRVSKHLAHLSEVRRLRSRNEAWDLTSTVIACRPTLKDFFSHCAASYLDIGELYRTQIADILKALDYLGTEEHFICHKHVSRSPFMSHDGGMRVSIPPLENA
jgi:hypothetical protein